MSFSTSALLEIDLDQQSVRDAKRTLSEELDNVTVDVSAGGAMPSGGNGGVSTRGMLRRDEERNELLSDAVLYLESLDDTLSEGGLLGGGGGGFGGILTEIAGAGAETAGDVAVEAGDTVAEAIQDTLVGTVSTALGTTVSDAITNSEVAVADGPLPVTPNPLPVEGGGGSGTTVSPTVNTNPKFSPTLKPTVDVAPEFDLPDLEFGSPGTVRVDNSQLPLPVDRRPIQVDAPDAIPVDAPEAITLRIGAPGGSPSERDPGFFERAGDDLDEIATDGDGPFGPTGRAIDTVNPFTSGGYDVGDTGGGGGGSTGARAVIESNNDVDLRPQYTINVDTDRLVDEVDRLVEDAQDEVRRELRDEIESVKREIDDLERQITRGR